MDTGYIREFVMLAECLNFSEAAERLFISQSSLSKHIQAMERELGLTLFERTTRTIRLSAGGEAYLPYAKKIAVLCSEAEIVLEGMKRPAAPPLIIAVMQNPQYYDLAKYITSFRHAHPDLPFTMVEADEFGLYDMFQKKLVNIFPTYSNFRGAESYAFMPLAESAIVAMFRRDHPCAEAGRVTLRALGRERLLLPARDGALSSLIHAAFRREGVAPQVVYEGSSTGCIDLVKAGMGVSLHGREFAASFRQDPAIVCAEIEPTLGFTYGLGYREPEKLSRAERLYLAHMKNYELR